ncbi:MAG: baseplate J/gp47 family protein [Labilithrix sp.]|nr:baseplate J/gp47 family protein [Labilithrix sp.]
MDFASGISLTLLARQMYGVDRTPATFGIGPVRMVNAGGVAYLPGENPAGSIRAENPFTGAKFFNAEALDLAPGQTKLVQFQAVTAGSAGSSPANSITHLENSLLGVTISNPSAITGRDDEDDDSLRAACRAQLASRSQLGIRGAYEWAVRQARRPDGSLTAVTRAPYVSESNSVGQVHVFLATPSGAPSSEDVLACTDSIEALARPSGVTVFVSGATEVAYARVCTIYLHRGVGADARSVQNAADSNIANVIAKWPIGGIAKPGQVTRALFSDAVKQAAWSAATPSHVYDVDLDDESDLPLTVSQVALNQVQVRVRIQ